MASKKRGEGSIGTEKHFNTVILLSSPDTQSSYTGKRLLQYFRSSPPPVFLCKFMHMKENTSEYYPLPLLYDSSKQAKITNLASLFAEQIGYYSGIDWNNKESLCDVFRNAFVLLTQTIFTTNHKCFGAG